MKKKMVSFKTKERELVGKESKVLIEKATKYLLVIFVHKLVLDLLFVSVIV
jgi:hypothetical protein